MSDHTNPLMSVSREELIDEVIRLRAEVARLTQHARDDRAASSLSDTGETSPQRTSAIRATRERLPEERKSSTRVFRLPYKHSDGSVERMHLYFTAGEYADGRPGEVFVKADRTGSMARGLMDAVAVLMSMLLQYGIPVEAITSKFRHTRFQPDGFTGDGEIHSCSSPLDLLAQWLELKYGQRES